MGIYNDLNCIIQEHSDSEEDQQMLDSAINQHLHDPEAYPYNTLPNKAQCILMEWEELERMT